MKSGGTLGHELSPGCWTEQATTVHPENMAGTHGPGQGSSWATACPTHPALLWQAGSHGREAGQPAWLCPSRALHVGTREFGFPVVFTDLEILFFGCLFSKHLDRKPILRGQVKPGVGLVWEQIVPKRNSTHRTFLPKSTSSGDDDGTTNSRGLRGDSDSQAVVGSQAAQRRLLCTEVFTERSTSGQQRRPVCKTSRSTALRQSLCSMAAFGGRGPRKCASVRT